MECKIPVNRESHSYHDNMYCCFPLSCVHIHHPYISLGRPDKIMKKKSVNCTHAVRIINKLAIPIITENMQEKVGKFDNSYKINVE